MSQLEEILNAVYRKDRKRLEQLSAAALNLRDQDGRTPLMHAVLAEDADADTVKLLISQGADVNATDNDQKWTALHFAARDQKEDHVRVLLDAGASVDAVDVFGNTPLWRASSEQSPKLSVLKALVDHGANPFRKSNYGVAPIDIAHQKQRADIAELFESARKQK
jgi:ankyrin repeat protein